MDILQVEIADDGNGRRFAFFPAGHADTIPGRGQNDYLDFFARIAPVLGTRVPRNRGPRALPPARECHRPLLTENLSAQILYGYGDPCILRVGESGPWYAVVTSNDAPNAFPILRSNDLGTWEPAGFVFPEGRTPPWARTGAGVSDFWAPELHRVGGSYLLCFAAREHDGSIAIGIAQAPSPEGPFAIPERPLLRGGVIDAHLFVGADGRPILYWKEDSNGVWPERLVEMIAREPALATRLFASEPDRRTALLAAAMWPKARTWPPMEQFFVLQPLIEAVVERFAAVREILSGLADPNADSVLSAMRTPIFAQPITPDGSRLLGERRVVLENDLEWEAHLIEGPWLTHQNGRYYLFYSGNDFSTHEYGIGVAVGETPFGPFRKHPEPLLRSDRHWIGPGHPSVALGQDGKPQLFYHAFKPGKLGYNVFRALLTCGLRFYPDRVEVSALQ